MTKWLQQYGVVLALVILLVVSALWKPASFLNPANLVNIINQNSFTGMVAVGMTLVIILAGIDLSVGSAIALVGSLVILLVNAMVGGGAAEPMAVAGGFLAAAAIGTLLGAFNGALVVYGRLAPFVATLGGLAAYRSLALVLGNAGAIPSKSSVFGSFGTGGIEVGPVTLTWNILIFILLAVLGTILLERTSFGRHVIAVGANEKASIYSAVPIDRVKVATYAFCGLCTGIAGFCLAARLNSVSTPNQGVFMELDAIAAVAIGGTAMAGGSGRIWGTVVGVLLLGVINNMMLLAEINSNFQGLVKGAIIVVAVLLQRGAKAG